MMNVFTGVSHLWRVEEIEEGILSGPFGDNLVVLNSLDGSYSQILLFLPVYLAPLTSNYLRPFKGQRIIVFIRLNFEKIIFRELQVNKVVVRPEGEDKPE